MAGHFSINKQIHNHLLRHGLNEMVENTILPMPVWNLRQTTGPHDTNGNIRGNEHSNLVAWWLLQISFVNPVNFPKIFQDVVHCAPHVRACRRHYGIGGEKVTCYEFTSGGKHQIELQCGSNLCVRCQWRLVMCQEKPLSCIWRRAVPF